MNSKLTSEGIMGAAMRMSAELSGGEFPISVFPHKIQRIITELQVSQGYHIGHNAAAMLSALAECYGMKEHTFKMMLKRHLGTLFKKINHGESSK